MKSGFRYLGNHLLILSTVGYGTGITLHSLIAVPTSVLYLLFASTILLCLFTSRTLYHRFASILFLFITFILFGMIQGNRNDIRVLDSNHIARLATQKQTVVVVGIVSRKVLNYSDVSRVQLDAYFVRTENSDTFSSTSGKVLLTLKDRWPKSILPGHSIAILAKVQPPPVINSPGAFNYRKYLARKHIYLTGTIASPVVIQPVKDLDRSFFRDFKYAIERQRSFIGKQIDTILPARTASLYKALIIGDRSAINPYDLEVFKRSGVLHILAISGMHLGLLAAIIYHLLYWLIRRCEWLILHVNAKKLALLVTLVPLLFYTLLAGGQPPVIRSFVMTSFFVLALITDRLHSPLTTLSGAAFLILLFDPMALESPSFQLSFMAVLAIVLFTPKLLSLADISNFPAKSILYKVLNPLLTLSAVTVSATIGTLPLMLIHFNRISLITLPANLLIEPIVCLFSLPIGFISVVSMFTVPELTTVMLKSGSYGLLSSLKIASFLSRPDFTQLWIPSPALIPVVCYYLFFVFLEVPKILKWSPFLSFAGFVFATLYLVIPLPHLSISAKPETSVSIIAVGHGSANVVRMKNGRVVMIDGGARSAPGYDCGERIIAPFLWSQKIAKVDDIVITHDDADHYNGLSTVIKRFRPERLWLPYLQSKKRGYNDLVKLAQKSQVQTIIPSAGLIIEHDKEKISVLAKKLADLSARVEDDKGLVLRLSTNQASVLFPGDISKQRERELIAEDENLESTILISPHHGSSTSNSYDFLSRVEPDYLIFSASGAKGTLFPSSKTLAAAKRLDIATLNTSVDGTITITMSDDRPGYQLTTYDVSGQDFWAES